MIIVAINGNGDLVRETKLPTAKRAFENFLAHLANPFRPWLYAQVDQINKKSNRVYAGKKTEIIDQLPY